MKFEGCIGYINASGNGSETFQVCSMTYNGNFHEQFVTIAHDGMIKVWNAETLAIVKSTRIKSGYLTSLINYQQGFIVGTGNGELIKFGKSLQRQWTKKIHFDCVNDIVQTQNCLVSVGSDGKICFLNKQTLCLEKEIETSVPLSKITRVGEQIYIAGNPSFKVNIRTFQIQKQRRSFQFIEFKGKILSCSDEKGVQILENEDSFDHINCHFMLEFRDRLIAVSQQMIGIVNLITNQEGVQQTRYRLYKAPNLKKGYSIRTGLVHENCIVLAGEEGFIYKFRFSDNEEQKE